MKNKIIGIFVFMLLIVTVLPTAGTVNVQTADNNINNSTMQNKYTDVFIGLITDMVKPNNNSYQLKCIIVFYSERMNGEFVRRGFIINQSMGINFDTKSGIVTKHIIFGSFTLEIGS